MSRTKIISEKVYSENNAQIVSIVRKYLPLLQLTNRTSDFTNVPVLLIPLSDTPGVSIKVDNAGYAGRDSITFFLSDDKGYPLPGALDKNPPSRKKGAIVHNVFSEDTADVVQLIKTTYRIGSRARLVYKRDFSLAPKTPVELGLLTSI